MIVAAQPVRIKNQCALSTGAAFAVGGANIVPASALPLPPPPDLLTDTVAFFDDVRSAGFTDGRFTLIVFFCVSGVSSSWLSVPVV